MMELYEAEEMTDGHHFINYINAAHKDTPTIETENEIVHLADEPWDLAMIGGEVNELKTILFDSLDIDMEELISIDGCFVQSDSGQLYQLVENTDDQAPFPSSYLPDNSGLVVRTANISAFESSLENDDESPAAPNDDPSETVLKMLAGLALVLSEKGGKYKRGERPNIVQIAKEIEEVCKGIPNADTFGLGSENIRNFIPKGLALLGNT
ncbi:hypothetical protein VI06_20620 [Aquitalea magnusonii]|nr:hypothetical protein VI06_20620 [Aquitalea magnusonii]